MTAEPVSEERPSVATDSSELGALVAFLEQRNAQLELALESRVVIEQAKGVLAERYRLEIDAAFEVLRGAARASRMRIHDLARNVVGEPATPPEIERQLELRPSPSVRATSDGRADRSPRRQTPATS